MSPWLPWFPAPMAAADVKLIARCRINFVVNTDYNNPFTPGVLNPDVPACINVSIIPDNVVENNEALYVSVLAAPSTPFPTQRAIVLIIDNDSKYQKLLGHVVTHGTESLQQNLEEAFLFSSIVESGSQNNRPGPQQ